VSTPKKPKRPAKPPEEWLGLDDGGNGSRRITAAERRTEAIEMRKRGMSYKRIAEELGYSSATAVSSTINKALRELPQEGASNLRKIELERLDQLLDAMWDKAMKGDGWAVDRCLKIMERRAKLMGIDAPIVTKVEVVSEDVIDKQIRQLERQMQQLPTGQATALRVQAERADREPTE
jgi:predicted transcriptional regulator